MSLSRRLMVAACCLAAGVVAQWGLRAHLRGAGAGSHPALHRPLAELPLELTAPAGAAGASAGAGAARWMGRDHPGREALAQRVPFADEFLLRQYLAVEDGGPLVQLYVVHSRTGEDRRHHPEVCLGDVAGAPEDYGARKTLSLDGTGARLAQRYRFRTGSRRYTVVYYWHYTFLPEPAEGQTVLQMLHQRVGRPAPSVTVQVSTEAAPEDLAAVEASFLPALDATLREHFLPATARVGCDRLPVTVNRE